MKTYHIITIGCQMNKSDSERIAGYLEELGYKKFNDKYRADLVVVTTCGVRQSAEDRIYGLIPRIKKENPKVKIVLTGCLSERKDVKKRLGDKVDLWIPINQISDIGYLILGKKENYQLQEKCNYLSLMPKYSSSFSAFVPIGNGCNNFCAYCVVPYARGREKYRDASDIIKEVEKLVANGYREVTLIAQNVNSYLSKSVLTNAKNKAWDLNGLKQINFAVLLRLINNISGDFWIRFATSHPKDMSDELIKTIVECDKVCEHVHLPAQSGDDEILKKMNRNYTRDDYVKLINKIKNSYALRVMRYALPVAITTDIIVGFPGETKEQFNNTKKLFKEIKFDMAYIAQYSPRPGTAAEKLEDDVSREEKKRREEELMKILRKTALENNKKYIGKVAKVLVEGKNKKGEWFGKTRSGKNVRVEELEIRNPSRSAGRKELGDLIGKFVDIKITGAEDFGLSGILK